jgi:hypothetical protein
MMTSKITSLEIYLDDQKDPIERRSWMDAFSHMIGGETEVRIYVESLEVDSPVITTIDIWIRRGTSVKMVARNKKALQTLTFLEFRCEVGF